ncbi:unnamed protein product [Penicillium bialowiezense]
MVFIFSWTSVQSQAYQLSLEPPLASAASPSEECDKQDCAWVRDMHTRAAVASTNIHAAGVPHSQLPAGQLTAGRSFITKYYIEVLLHTAYSVRATFRNLSSLVLHVNNHYFDLVLVIPLEKPLILIQFYNLKQPVKMASYHRVLETFGRSIQDNTLECDCDLHPWEISINEEQWAGKIRFIGFVDVFFLISYSANARFEHGIIVYKDKLALEELTGIRNAKPNSEDRQDENDADEMTELQEPEEDLTELEAAGDEANADVSSKDAEQSSKDGSEQATQLIDKTQNTSEDIRVPEVRNTSNLSIKSLGHPIGLRASYPKSWIRSYKVEITKPASWALSKRIIRGLKVHSTYDLMNDVIRCGLITQGQLAGHIMGVLLAGSRLDDTTKKYLAGLTSGNDAGRQALSNERV